MSEIDLLKEEIEDLLYQTVGADWLTRRKYALLADEMGLGKSRQLIMASELIKAKTVLVIAPSIARINWQREFKKFSTTTKLEVIDKKAGTLDVTKSSVISYAMAEHFISIINVLYNEAEKFYDAMFIDESHLIQNLETKRTLAILGKTGFIKRAKRVWFASGTPASNHAGGLWPILFTVGLTKLSYENFLRRYCDGYFYRGRFAVSGTKESMIPELRKMLKGFMLRRLVKDVASELPPARFTHIPVETNEIDFECMELVKYVAPVDTRQTYYDKVKKEAALVETLLTSLKHKQHDQFLPGLEALVKSTSTLRMYVGASKVQSIADIISTHLKFKTYSKVVIFAIHRIVIEGLRERLKEYNPLTIYGGTPPDKKQRHMDKFNNIPKFQVLIANINACGVAISLTGANNVAFAEQSWVPGDNQQALKRVHRKGQKETVFVRFYGAVGTIDDKVSNVLKNKTRQLTKLFDKV